MSEAPGVKCDRCGKRTLLPIDGKTARGWGWIQLGRSEPFRKTEVKDLCPECFETVEKFAVTMPVAPVALVASNNGTHISGPLRAVCTYCHANGSIYGVLCSGCGGAGFVSRESK